MGSGLGDPGGQGEDGSLWDELTMGRGVVHRPLDEAMIGLSSPGLSPRTSQGLPGVVGG